VAFLERVRGLCARLVVDYDLSLGLFWEILEVDFVTDFLIDFGVEFGVDFLE
jgi:hypothetical protein